MDENSGEERVDVKRQHVDAVLALLTVKQLDILKQFPGAMIAGGAIRAVVADEPVADIDVFAESEESASQLAHLLDLEVEPFYSEHAYTIRASKTSSYPIQVIHRWTYASPQEVLAGFDFTVTKAVIWWNRSIQGWESMCDPSFYKHVHSKTLRYTAPPISDGLGSAWRILKYIRRGYNIETDSYAGVLARLVSDVFNPSVVAGMTWEEAAVKDKIREALVAEEARRMEGY